MATIEQAETLTENLNRLGITPPAPLLETLAFYRAACEARDLHLQKINDLRERITRGEITTEQIGDEFAAACATIAGAKHSGEVMQDIQHALNRRSTIILEEVDEELTTALRVPFAAAVDDLAAATKIIGSIADDPAAVLRLGPAGASAYQSYEAALGVVDVVLRVIVRMRNCALTPELVLASTSRINTARDIWRNTPSRQRVAALVHAQISLKLNSATEVAALIATERNDNAATEAAHREQLRAAAQPDAQREMAALGFTQTNALPLPTRPSPKARR